MKHVYNEQAKFIESYALHFDIKGPSNLTEMMPVIGMDSMVPRNRLAYTRNYLTAGMCSFIKPTDIVKKVSRQNPQSCDVVLVIPLAMVW